MRLLFFPLSTLLIFFSTYLSAQDTVVFKSGERVVGSLKSLEMGALKFDSDDLGIVNVDWEKVASIKTDGLYEITFKNRTKHFGNFDAGDTIGQIVLVEESGNRLTLAPHRVVSIGELETAFRDKINGSVDAGLSFTKASDVFQYNLAGRISYKTKKWFTQLSGSIIVTEQEGTPNSRNSFLKYELQYSLINRIFVGLELGTEQNSALGLENRYTSGLFLGNDFIYTQVHKLYGKIGAISNIENARDSSAISSIEGVLSAGYVLYNSGVRDFYLDINATTYPSFTVNNRWRGEVNVNPKVEIISDLKLGLKYYYIFDTKPLVEDVTQEDWGIIMTLSYSF